MIPPIRSRTMYGNIRVQAPATSRRRMGGCARRPGGRTVVPAPTRVGTVLVVIVWKFPLGKSWIGASYELPCTRRWGAVASVLVRLLAPQRCVELYYLEVFTVYPAALALATRSVPKSDHAVENDLPPARSLAIVEVHSPPVSYNR